MPLPILRILPVKRKETKCGICNKIYNSQHFKRHMKCHLKKSNDSEIIYCEHCKAALPFSQMSNHLQICSQNEIITPSCSNKEPPIFSTDDLFCDNNIIKKLKSKQKALQTASKLNVEELKVLTGNVDAMIIENKQSEIEIPLKLDSLFPWQQEILDLMVPDKYDNRSIYVLYDKQGGIGKTTLKQYVEKFDNFITISGSKSCALYPGRQKLMKNLIAKNWNVLIDLPRSTQYMPNFVELIKDRIWPSHDYRAKQLIIPNANIFVFLNNLDLLKSLSFDRIKIFIVEDSQLKEVQFKFAENKIKLIREQKYKKESPCVKDITN